MNALLYLLTVLIWGTSWFAIKFQISEVDPIASVFYRFALATVLMLVLCKVKHIKLNQPWRHHVYFAFLGLLLFSGNYVLFYYATYELVSGLIAVIFSLMLVFNTLLSWVFFNTRPDRALVAGCVLGLSGISLVFYQDMAGITAQQGVMIGIGLSLLASLAASAGNIISRHLQNQSVQVLAANYWGMLYGTVILLLLMLVLGKPWQLSTTPSFVISLLYLSIFATIIAFWTYLTLLGRVGPGRAAYATVLFPIVALLVSTLFEGFDWNAIRIVGVALTLFGNILIIPNNPVLRWWPK